MFGKKLTGSLADALAHLKEAGVLAKMDLKDVLKHSEIDIDFKKQTATIRFSKEW